MCKHFAIAAVSLATVVMPHAHADEPKPDHELTFNASITSDYRYRGISQARLDPALQGGADYTHHPTGLYAGTWLSTIRWIKDTPGAGSTPAEWDVYGGRKGNLADDITYDAGVLGYIYVNNRLSEAGLTDAHTLELYAQAGYGPAYLKYSHAFTNLFGIPDSRNSGYLDVGANIDLPEAFKLNLHVGRQNVRSPAPASYTDYKVGVSRDISQLSGATLAVAAVGTNANENVYASPANGKFLGKKALVASLTKTF